jgi:hypothetical protein
MMNREVRDLWTTALRSGYYRQPTGRLTRTVADDDAREYIADLVEEQL